MPRFKIKKQSNKFIKIDDGGESFMQELKVDKELGQFPGGLDS